jgi:hypothetical protein
MLNVTGSITTHPRSLMLRRVQGHLATKNNSGVSVGQQT